MSQQFVKYLSSLNSPASRAALALYEQVCSDVNMPPTSPGQPCCTQELNENEYFDAQTLSDEKMQKVHQAKTGYRRVLAPAAGRTPLGIMGTKAPQNVCASSGSSKS
jgi:hypothetical protein